MKRIVLFLLLFLCIPMVKAETFYPKERLAGEYISTRSGNEIHNGLIFILRRRSDDKVVYCINPFYRINETESYEEDNNLLSKERKDKLNLIAYYGYGYKEHTSEKWYVVSQYMIWKEMGYDEVYFTEGSNGSKIDKYKEEINEIETLITNYYKTPTFSKKTISIPKGLYTSLVDDYGTLSDFTIDSSIEAKITAPKILSLKSNLSGNYKVNLIKKLDVSNESKVYVNDGHQPLILPGRVEPIKVSLNVDVYGVDITINKKDSENISYKNAFIKGAKYGVYNDKNELVGTILIGDDNKGTLKDLVAGYYKIKELEPGVGYQLDKTIYDVNMRVNKSFTLNLTNKVIKARTIINKYNDTDIDNDSCFTIDGKEYKTVNGKIELDLVYGKHTVSHTCGYDSWSKIDDFDIDVKDTNDLVYNLVSKRLKEESINQDKKEYDIVEVPNTYATEVDYTFVGIVCILLGMLIIKKVTILK